MVYEQHGSMIVGLTGGIGSGKTLATDYLSRHWQLGILDSDITARQVVSKGSPVLNAILAHFGPEVLTSEGELNRPWLRAQIFNHPEDRTWLESVTHPEIAKRTQHRLSLVPRQEPFILVSPLLFESGQSALCDITVTISATDSLRQARVSQRDGSAPETIAAIMASQYSDEQKEQLADVVVYNTGSPEHLYKQLDNLVIQWKATK